MGLDLIAQIATVCMFLFPDTQMLTVTISGQANRMECFKALSTCYSGFQRPVHSEEALTSFDRCANDYLRTRLK